MDITTTYPTPIARVWPATAPAASRGLSAGTGTAHTAALMNNKAFAVKDVAYLRCGRSQV